MREISNNSNEEEKKDDKALDPFIQLEIKLRMKKRAREMIENKEKNVENMNEQDIVFEVTTKPEEPLPQECCGSDCPNCVWIDYADKMVKYQEYLDAQK